MDPAITDVACAGLHGMAMGDRNLTCKRANSAVKAQQEQAGMGGMGAPGALPGLGGMPMPFQPVANAARVVKLAHAGARRWALLGSCCWGPAHAAAAAVPGCWGGLCARRLCTAPGAAPSSHSHLLAYPPAAAQPNHSPAHHHPLPPATAVTMEELADEEEWKDIMEDMREECARYGTVVAVHIPRPGPPGAPPPPGLGKVLIEFTGGWLGGCRGVPGRVGRCASAGHAACVLSCSSGLLRGAGLAACQRAHPLTPSATSPLTPRRVGGGHGRAQCHARPQVWRAHRGGGAAGALGLRGTAVGLM